MRERALADGAVSQAPSARLGYRPAFDGLRATAILLVVLYHFGVDPVSGGWLGVDLFFVLSGFLITRLIVQEFSATREFAPRRFYRRRVARLLPAYLALVAVVLVFANSGMFGNTTDIKRGIFASATLTANWFGIAKGVGALGPFAHLWSLSVEQQFYLVWPVVLVAALRRHAPARVGRGVAIAAVLVFVQLAIRSLLWPSERYLYVGSDGQPLGFLLIGCALGLVLATDHHALASSRIGRVARRWGVLFVVPIVPFVMFGEHSDKHFFYYRGALALIGGCMAVVLVACLVDSPVRRAMSIAPLVWIGVRSYGIYLWHYPMVVAVPWIDNRYHLHLGYAGRCALAGTATLLLAMASYRLVERPLRARLAGHRPVALLT
jgi:peptidoglycan/LPS O-acetylase OafA/YrhL